MTFTAAEVRAYYATRMPDLQINAQREWRGPCPIHQGDRDSFSVNSETGLAQCHSACQRGWDIVGLEMELTRADFPKAKAEVFRIVGRPEVPWEDRDIEAAYNYRDEQGAVRYQVVRKFGKRFMQRRPNDGKGGWEWGLGEIAPLPYDLPRILKAQLVAVVEGEKDAVNLTRLGMPATCNSGGAGNFKPELAHWFAGKDVAIFPDNDEPGRKHAAAVARLLQPVARSVKIVEIPELPLKGDVSDFIAKSGTLDQLNALYVRAAAWTPDYDFPTALPRENDRYNKTIMQVFEDAGGLNEFWNLTKRNGLPTPFPKLTRILRGGLKNGELYIIGGNMGSGKTSLALQFILTVLQKGHGVVMFSMEMDHEAVTQRLCGIDARVDLVKFWESQEDGRENREDRLRLSAASTRLAPSKIVVSTKPRVTPKGLVAEIEYLVKRNPVQLVVVDHMQLMNSESNHRSGYEKLTEIAHGMKQVAEDLRIPVLLLSQTSRVQTHEHRAEVEVSDLRDSGAIEESADAIFLLFEDKEDAKASRQFGDGTRYTKGPVKTWLKCGKNRYGEQGRCLPLLHYKSECRFEMPNSEEQGRSAGSSAA